jgi:hypothetical protein
MVYFSCTTGQRGGLSLFYKPVLDASLRAIRRPHGHATNPPGKHSGPYIFLERDTEKDSLRHLNGGLKVEGTAQIFLSYAREDEGKVEKLYQQLSDAGFKSWMDKKDILPGEQWESRIREAIRHSDFFLVCVSANSIDKRGWIQREIKQALDIWQEMLDSDIYLIPVRLEDCGVPESLRKFQWVNLFEKDGWAQLVKAIQAGMERREEVIKPYPVHEGPSPGEKVVTPSEERPERVLRQKILKVLYDERSKIPGITEQELLNKLNLPQREVLDEVKGYLQPEGFVEMVTLSHAPGRPELIQITSKGREVVETGEWPHLGPRVTIEGPVTGDVIAPIIQGSRNVVVGKDIVPKTAPEPHETERATGIGLTPELDERQQLRALLDKRRRNLYKLEDQRATYAAGEEPLQLLNRIEREEDEIARLKARIAALDAEDEG